MRKIILYMPSKLKEFVDCHPSFRWDLSKLYICICIYIVCCLSAYDNCHHHHRHHHHHHHFQAQLGHGTPRVWHWSRRTCRFLCWIRGSWTGRKNGSRTPMRSLGMWRILGLANLAIASGKRRFLMIFFEVKDLEQFNRFLFKVDELWRADDRWKAIYRLLILIWIWMHLGCLLSNMLQHRCTVREHAWANGPVF